MKKALLFSGITFLHFFSNAQFQNGLVAGFSFNGNYTDQSPSNITGTNTGGSFVADHLGNSSSALDLTGSSYYGFNNNAVKVSFPLTISAWVNLADIGISQPLFFSDNELGNYGGYFLNTIAGTGQPSISFSGANGAISSSNRRTYVSDMYLQENTWYHIVGIINAYNDMRIYVDCQLTTGTYNGSGSQTMVYSNTESRIGSSNNNGGQYVDGSVDELMIWDRLLTTTEIEMLCSSSLKVKELTADNSFDIILGQSSDGDLLFIESADKADYMITLFDLAGKKLLVTAMKNGKTQLDISSLPSQSLLVEVKGADHSVVKHVVK